MALSKKWLESKCKFEDHFIAITSQPDKAENFGFKENIIQFPNEIEEDIQCGLQYHFQQY